ncbi:MAG: Stp1/IreP family PP2C-type Ser/Thr phosphatase [bacterium]
MTEVGLKRRLNEDNFAISDELGLFVVADGMGGHAAGEIASCTAIREIMEFVRRTVVDSDFTWPFGVDSNLSETANVLLTATRLANRSLCTMAEQKKELSGMGTTIAGMLLKDNQAVIVHVGDSRAYRFRDGELELLTRDHSWVNEQLERKVITEEEARTHRWKNVITRALGNRLDLEIDLRSEIVQPGDVFLLCTDGLSGMIPGDEIEQVLKTTLPNLELTCSTLVNRANAHGGLDNVTTVLVRLVGTPEEEAAAAARAAETRKLSDADTAADF